MGKKIQIKLNPSVQVKLPEGRYISKQDIIKLLDIGIFLVDENTQEDITNNVIFSEDYLNEGFTVEKDRKEIIKLSIDMSGQEVDLKREILFDLIVERSTAIRDFEEKNCEKEHYKLYEHFLMLGHKPGLYNIPEMEFKIPEDINVEAVDILVRPIKFDGSIDNTKDLAQDDFTYDEKTRYISWKFRSPEMRLPFSQEKNGFVGLAYSVVIKEVEVKEIDPWAEFSSLSLDDSSEENQEAEQIEENKTPNYLENEQTENIHKEPNDTETKKVDTEEDEYVNPLIAQPFSYGDVKKETGNSVFKKEELKKPEPLITGFDDDDFDLDEINTSLDGFDDVEEKETLTQKIKKKAEPISEPTLNLNNHNTLNNHNAKKQPIDFEDDDFYNDIDLNNINNIPVSKKEKKKKEKKRKEKHDKPKKSKGLLIGLISGAILLGGLGAGGGYMYKTGTDKGKVMEQKLKPGFDQLDEILKKDKLNTDEKITVSNILNQSFAVLEENKSSNPFAAKKKGEMIDKYNERLEKAEQKLNN